MAVHSIGNTPWLIPQRMPGEALASGVRSGSAIAANLLHAKAMAQQRAYQQQQIEFEERRLKLEEATAPLRAQIVQNQLKLQAFDIADSIRKQDDLVRAREAVSLLGSHISRAFQGDIAGEDATMAQALRIVGRYPEALSHPEAQRMLTLLTEAKKTKDAREELEAKQDFRLQEIAMLEAGRNERADTAAEARVASAEITAQSRVLAAQERASNWGNHARFTEFKAAIDRAAKTAITDEEFAVKVEEAERLYAPRGMPAGGIAPSTAPAGSTPWDRYQQFKGQK